MMKRMAMRMRIDKNYYSIMVKYPEDDGTCFSLQTRFDKCGDAVKAYDNQFKVLYRIGELLSRRTRNR